MVYERPKGNLTINSDRTVSLNLPKIIKFERLEIVEAIKAIKQCIGLSDHERDYLIRAIYLRTDQRPWPFM